MKLLTLCLLAAIGMAGCGGQTAATSCTVKAIRVSPSTATVDHNAASPGNSQQFLAFQTASDPGCSWLQSNLGTATWSLSDNVNATISNSHDQGNANYGRAICVNAAPAPITVTATVPSGDGSNVNATATLTCN